MRFESAPGPGPGSAIEDLEEERFFLPVEEKTIVKKIK
jgi:hypothetical protein